MSELFAKFSAFFSKKDQIAEKNKNDALGNKKNQQIDQDADLKPVSWFIRSQLNIKIRMRLYEKVGKFADNGVPLSFALEQMYVHASDEGKKPKNVSAIAIDSWRKNIRNGASFSEAMKGWAPADEISVLNAGESAGHLNKAIEDVLFLYSAKKKIKAAFAGIIYPIVLLACTCFFMLIFGGTVVPAFKQILPEEKWPDAGKALLALSKFVMENGLLFTVIILVSISTVILFTFPYWTGNLRNKLDSIPPWSIYRTGTGCSFLISLSALLEAGVSAPEALNIMSKTANPWYKERLLATRRALLNGAINIGDALYSTQLNFPSKDMIMDIRSYASLDGFESMLNKLSKQWQDESVESIQAQMNVFKTVAIIIMAVVFLAIMIGMFTLLREITEATKPTF